MPNILSFEITSNSGKAKDEIVSLLNETKTKASEASRAFNDLRNASIEASAATSTQSNKIKDLQTNLARVAQQYKETRSQIQFHTQELKAEERAAAELYQKLGELKTAQAGLASAGGNNKQANQLRVTEQALVGAIDQTNAKIREREAALKTLTTREDSQITAKRLLVQGLINEKEQLNALTSAQQTNNREKQKASQTTQQLEKEIRTLKAQMRELESQEKNVERQTNKMTAAQVAAATVVGNMLYNAMRRLVSGAASFIEEAVIYSARTDEMKIAMLGMGEASGHTRGELLAQEEGIRKLNITTQEARQTLVKFELAQLDIAKAATLARAAQDLGVIAGVETGEELDRLTHGIVTLQTRVLRTAGVNITLIESYKKVAQETGRSVASFSAEEKQAIALNAVIAYASRATDLYGLSLDNAGKRMRSMTRLFQEMENAVGGLLQGPFGNLVDTLSGLLTFAAAFPKIVAGAVLVLGVFAATVLKSAFANTYLVTQFKQLIAYIPPAIKQTLGLAAANTELAVAATGSAEAVAVQRGTLATFGTGLLAIGKNVALFAAILLAANAALSAFAEISKALGGSTTLNPDTANLIDLEKAKKDYKEINDELERRINLGRADKSGKGLGVRGALERVGDSVAGPLGISALGGYDQQTSEALAKQAQELQDNIDKTNAKLGVQKTAIEVASGVQKEYDEQLEKGGKANLDFSGTAEFMQGRLQMLSSQFEALTKPMNDATGYTLSLTERLNVLSPEILALDTVMQKSATSQDDYNQKIAEAEEKFPGFTAALTQLRSQSEKYIVGVGEAAGTANRHLVDVQRRLNEMKIEIRGLFSGTGQAGTLELEEKRLQIVRQEIDAINTARINLNRDVGQPIPTNREERLSLQDVYETAVKVRDEIRAAQRANKDFIAEVVKAQQLASDARSNVISAELSAAKMIADNQVKRVQDERQLTAEIIALSKDREERAKEEAGQGKRAFGDFYKEQLENLIKVEDNSRRLKAQGEFGQGRTPGSLDIPVFAKINTALENIAIPAATDTENIANISTQVQEINAKMSIADNVPFDKGLMGQIDKSPNGPWTVDAKKQYDLWKSVQPTGAADYGDVGTHGRTGTTARRTLSSSQIAGVLKTAGWPDNLIPVMTAIAQAESSGDTGNTNFKGKDQSYGLWQINMLGKLGPERRAKLGISSNDELLDPVTNARAARMIESGRGGLHNWSTFDNGSYRKYFVGGNQGISPRLEVGAAGTSFKQAGSYRANAISPEQIVGAYQGALASNRAQRAKQGGLPDINDVIAYYNKIEELEKGDFDTKKDTQAELAALDSEYKAKYFDSEAHRTSVTATAELSRKKSYIATHDTLLVLIDEENKRTNESTRRRLSEIEAAEIRAREAYKASRDSLIGIQDDQKNRQTNYQRYLDTIHNTGEGSRIKITQDAEDKYNQMIDETNSHWRESMEFRLVQWRNFETERYNEAKKAQDDLDALDDAIAHATDLDPIKIETARKKAILEEAQADGEARASMAANAEHLANAQIYHADRANARILDYMAKQKSVDEIVSDARINTMEAIFGAIDNGLGKITSKLGVFGDIVKEIISGFARLALSKVFMTLFGISPTGSGGAGQPQGKSSGVAGAIQGLLGGFGASGPAGSIGFGGGGGTPFSGGVSSGGGLGAAIRRLTGGAAGGTGAGVNGISGLFSDFGQGGSGALTLPPEAARLGFTSDPFSSMGGGAAQTGLAAAMGGGSILRGLGGAVAPMLPLMGAGLGAQLGGGGLGSVLGGAGGLLLGGAGAFGLAGLLGGGALAGTAGGTIFGAGGFLGTALGGGGAAGGGAGLLGTAGAFLTNPITIGVGVALIAAAIIIGKNKKRQAAERTRDKLMVDSLGALNQLLNQVRRDKIGVDEALAQAISIRAQYVTNSEAITDKKTRNIALKDVSRLDSVITQIKAAGVAQSKRQQLDRDLVPEFASGGYVQGPAGMAVPIIAHSRELVLNPQQQAAVGFSALARANVPKYNRGASYGSGGYVRSSGHGLGGGDMNIYLVTDKKFAETMAVEGRDKIVSLSASDMRDKGKLHAAVRSVR